MSICKIDTGIGISTISSNIYIQIVSRSGIALNHSCIVVAGLIDPSFTGRIQILLHNTSPTTPFEIKKGDRIAQLILLPLIASYSFTL